LLGHGYQYMRIAQVTDPAEVCLMVVADRIPASFLAQLALCRAELVEHEHGLWLGHAGGFVLHGVETRKAAEVDHLLFTFSREYLAHPEGVARLDPEEARVYLWLYRQVEQLRRARGTMATKDNEELQKAHREAMKSLIEYMTPEERLAGIPPEQLLAGLSPEQLLAGLSPEQREELKRLLH
jgi:hypothetical protein